MRNSKKKTKIRVVYEQVENLDQDAINRAYDILFEEVLRIKKEKRRKEDKEKR